MRFGSWRPPSAGRSNAFYFAFGGDDFNVIVDLPDNVAAAAVATAVAATGAVNVKTTVLLTAEEVDAASKVDVCIGRPGAEIPAPRRWLARRAQRVGRGVPQC